MDEKEKAIRGIVQRLRRTRKYAAALVERLTVEEVSLIARHARNESGAVAIAAMIFRARRRLDGARFAHREAKGHYRTILETVRQDRRQKEEDRFPPVPGIRIVPLPSEYVLD